MAMTAKPKWTADLRSARLDEHDPILPGYPYVQDRTEIG
jgi:hypothetical protein